MNFFGKRVLFLGAHPDDIELGCGALLHKIAKKTDVLCVTLSDNQKNPDLQKVKSEHFQSMQVLDVPEEKIVLGPFTTRVFPDARQEILEYFLKLRKDFNPDLIFTHTRQDVHQDHNTMTDEALRAFRGITVLGFDVVRSSYGFFPSFLVEVSEENAAAKIEALSKYETYRDRYYFNAELTRSIMVRHGALAERPLAEGFDILRIVGKFGE
ncbi:MAG TPA: PIG-L family deacetylase [Anaerolineales bacterium]|nr:PIG-L family deacetylase [Anaerolineales bacterium]HMV95613.1 PIG-L family deacetylase [Anaerolineales bacterium]HMX19535.1 PIG-L family deacetylase [Anaerolineales bacterium]HMX74865.1 PIG-L family deacetylase [Anaerolineales bacterium]HMZ43894.1 PIG-L family deacetylase [Anaerolineales bacterium]